VSDARFVDALSGHEVVIVGDVMLDRYWWGTVSRLSPEAPVPVVHKTRSTTAPGGAANVAANVASLGGRPRLVSLVGVDEAGRELRATLEERGIECDHLVADSRRPTTVKTRVVAHSQHVVRVDEEERSPVGAGLATAIAERVRALLTTAPVLVISDYAKGLLTRELLSSAIREARSERRRTVVDPKGSDYSQYDGAHLLCPNRGEALAATGVSPDDPEGIGRAGRRLLDAVKVDAVLITLGEQGMALFERGQPPMQVPALARAVYDVTGAGDTVVAVVSLALAAGLSLRDGVRLANVAAGLAVERVGTTAVTAQELRQACRGGSPDAPAGESPR